MSRGEVRLKVRLGLGFKNLGFRIKKKLNKLKFFLINFLPVTNKNFTECS